MPGGVFICYRRDDSAAPARLVYDRLAKRLGRKSVFLDVENIPPGVNFVELLTERVSKCDALIVVIGKSWISSADARNQRRLDDPRDFVRIEIQAALERGIPVIPALVDGAAMPEAVDLPDDLRKLTERQAIEVFHNRLDSDLAGLARALFSPRRWRGVMTWVAAVAAIVAVIAVAILLNFEFRSLQARTPIDLNLPTAAPPATIIIEAGTEVSKTADHAEAERRYRLAADAGNAQGQVMLGLFYQNGLGGLQKDDHEAARLYKLAADQGNPDGQANLGLFYQNGRGGLPKDEREAARLYKLAADKGNATGQADLGILYSLGLGDLPKDDNQAARLLKLSADQGNATGQASLGALYREGLGGLPRDDHEAARLFKLSADQGDRKGQARLAGLYEDGLGGLPKDENEAARLFKLAADQGYAEGQVGLGFFYRHGLGRLPKDEREAARLYKLAADQGDPNGQADLGVLYRDGLGGLPKDNREAGPPL